MSDQCPTLPGKMDRYLYVVLENIFQCLVTDIFDCYFNKSLSAIMTEETLYMITDKNMSKLQKIVLGMKSLTNVCDFYRQNICSVGIS